MIIPEKTKQIKYGNKFLMKNIPRIFIGGGLESGAIIPASRDVAHYLSRVMRTDSCLVFGSGNEFSAKLSADGKNIIVGDKTMHNDPSNDITLYFAPIKRIDDLINMATQMGIKGMADPSKVLKLHQQVMVTVISVDLDRDRIGLRLNR